MPSNDLENRANEYSALLGLKIVSRSVSAPMGWFFETDRETAVKVVERRRNYLHELQSYQRLKAKQINSLRGFSIPVLIHHHDPLMVIEMTIVTAPYLIDFGKVYIDQPPDPAWFQQIEIDGHEHFEDRWPEVRSLLGLLQLHGIYYLDPKPGNIKFRDDT
jgi:hypothetical protein